MMGENSEGETGVPEEQNWRPQFGRASSDLRGAKEPRRLAGLGARFLLLAPLFAVLAACGSPFEQLNAADSVPEATAETAFPTFTPTITPSPSPTPTPSPPPTETLIPTPTSEPLPSSCLNPEANEQVKQDFLEFRGISSLDDVLSKVTRREGFAGLENGPSWYIFSDLKVLGGYRISLEGQQGFGKGDFANCLIAAQPRLGEDSLIPIVVGVQRSGEWSQTAATPQRNFNSSPSVPGETVFLYSPEEADSWIESLRGEEGGREIEIHPLVVVRFDKPDWDSDPLWHFGYDQVLPLLKREEGYIMRYTRNPSLLGEPMSLPDGRPWGERTGFGDVVPELNSGDIGMFAWQITVFREAADLWPAPRDLVVSEQMLVEGADLLPMINPPGWRPGHSITRSEGNLIVTNNDDDSWIAGPVNFPNLPLPKGFTLTLNMTGRAMSLWGREGYFADRETYSEWWQGINVVYIGQYDDEALHMTFYDGRSSDSYDVTLPSSVQPGSPFYLKFLDPQGMQIEILDESGGMVLLLDIAELTQVDLPNGIFPDRRLVFGTFVGPNEQLALSEFRIDYEISP